MFRSGLLVRAAFREGRTAHASPSSAKSAKSPVAVAPLGSGTTAAATAATAATASAAPTPAAVAVAVVQLLLHGLAVSVEAVRAAPPSGGINQLAAAV